MARPKKAKKMKEFKPIRPLPAGRKFAPVGQVPPVDAERFKDIDGQLDLFSAATEPGSPE